MEEIKLDPASVHGVSPNLHIILHTVFFYSRLFTEWISKAFFYRQTVKYYRQSIQNKSLMRAPIYFRRKHLETNSSCSHKITTFLKCYMSLNLIIFLTVYIYHIIYPFLLKMIIYLINFQVWFTPWTIILPKGKEWTAFYQVRTRNYPSEEKNRLSKEMKKGKRKRLIFRKIFVFANLAY